MRRPHSCLFALNGLGELIAALLFLTSPESLGFAAPLDDNARFLFQCWAWSIAGFGVMTIAAANEAATTTRSLTLGAMLYHTAVATTYARNIRSGLLLEDWMIVGAVVHAAGAVGFAHHYATRVVNTASRKLRSSSSAVDDSDTSAADLTRQRARSRSGSDLRMPDSSRLERTQWSTATAY